MYWEYRFPSTEVLGYCQSSLRDWERLPGLILLSESGPIVYGTGNGGFSDPGDEIDAPCTKVVVGQGPPYRLDDH